MTIETTVWNVQDHLQTEDDRRRYLEAAFEDGDPALIAAAVGDVARAQGASEVARKAGISREALYKAFQKDGNPTLATLAKVMKALNLKLQMSPLD